ncbi:WxL domain-containing protein [Companilactobacillus mishanensis]|uniref:WxL domain-containing protein n=1 Tax=Companilactobacillus mishanensis TaxID=2486008 RepID=UPI0012971102|nr:WxL domain-containing protein [Companilactobacillus mishanensis]MQS90212.1 hypothetical protein [Companilactobacillus mishanensis]
MKKHSIIIVLTLVVSLLFGTLLVTETLVNGDNKDATIEESDLTKFSDGETASSNVTPRKTPSPGPTTFLGIVTWPGFKIQPRENYYAQVGTNVRIQTKYVKVVESGRTNFQWHGYTPGTSNSWKELSNSKDNYIDVTSDKAGTKYFQLNVEINPFYRIYSNMAAVHFSEKPVDAQKLDVSLDNDYLSIDENFNKVSAFATAKPDPINATGKITFASEDEDLIQVNEETGEIVQSGSNKVGTAMIKASIKKSDGTEVIGHAPITVGHVLTGPNFVYAGKEAKFKLNGNIDTNNFQIDWYQKKGSTESVLVSNGNTEITIPVVNKDDDGAMIYAKLKNKATSKTTSTNSIKLTVKDIRPIFEVYQFIGRYSSSIFFTRAKEIKDLTPDYDLMHALIITDQSEDPNISWRLGTVYAPISKNEDVVSVEIQNRPQKYIVKEINGKKTVIIPDFGVKHKSGVEVKIRTTVIKDITEEYYEYNPSFVAYDVAGNEFIVRFPKNTATFQMPDEPEETPDPDNSSNNLEEKIKIDPAHINFGKHPKSSNQEIHMVKKQDKEEMVKITDKRDEFSPVKLSVQSEGPFHKKEDKTSEAPITFKFITKEGNDVNLRDDIVVKRTKEGQPLESIKWNEFEGLKIYVKHNQFDDGNYTTSLKWTVSNAP